MKECRLTQTAREQHWAAWMTAAQIGDQRAYGLLLRDVTPVLRGWVISRCGMMGAGEVDAEDIVQEILLAIHLKRHTWDVSRPIGAWLNVITRNKLVDALRKRPRGTSVPIEDLTDILESPIDEPLTAPKDLERFINQLNEKHAAIVRAVSLEEVGISEAARRFNMSEGAVRVNLHRALKKLASLYRADF